MAKSRRDWWRELQATASLLRRGSKRIRMTGFLKTVLAGPLLLAPFHVWATAPQLTDISPTGGQRGSELVVTFHGERLQDTQEVLCYEPGITVGSLTELTEKSLRAKVKLAPDCRLGELHLRLRTATGLSDLRTFLVGSFPVTDESEPNGERAQAQKVPMNTTVAGVIQNEDRDCFAVEVKQGQRFAAEVEGMRLGRGDFDPRLTVFDPQGAVLGDSDDTWLGKQDPFLALVAPRDGTYLVQVREATYRGNEQCKYRLHIGTFARPSAVFPAGARAGDTNAFVFLTPGGPSFTNVVALPGMPQEKFGLFAENDGQYTPSPNWIRVSGFPNVLASGTNHTREQATATDLQPPFALNGILETKGQANWFRFPAAKASPLNVAVWSRRLHLPVDSVVEVYDLTGKSLGSSDDVAGADSVLKFTPPETASYFVRVQDTLGQGGPDFVYRIEVTPDTPALTLKIPEVSRNDTQSRQFVAIPRGNRSATLISARRANFGGELSLAITNLPPGVTMNTNAMAANVDAMPLVFEAAADAPVGGRLLDLVGQGQNGTNPVTGRFRQDVDLVQGPNNTSYYGTAVAQFCVAVTKEAPFRLRIGEPQVPLVQSGSMSLQVIAERAPGFEEPIDVQMLWNPPGVSAQPEITIPKGATNAVYPINAAPGAEARVWKIAVLGRATVEGGQVYVSSQLTDLEVATPYLMGKIETLWVNPGKTGKLTLNVQHAKTFEGKAKIKLAGLPDKVTTVEKEISKGEQEVVFDLIVQTNCPMGSHKNLFCTVEIPENGTVIQHTIAPGGVLRIMPPRKTEGSTAVAGGPK
jgi:hypothetical protein